MSGKIAAILLAAGLSRRMGRCKQLLPLGDRTVMARCIGTLCLAGIDETIVVVSPEGDKVAAEAWRFPVRVVVTPEPDGDMASSVRAGRGALSAGVVGVVVALCDHPLVQPATVAELIRTHREHPDHIIIPCHGGRKGHPLLFPVPVLHELHGGLTLRDLVRRDPARIVALPVADVGVLLDMDTPEDYRAISSLATPTKMHRSAGSSGT
jgi:CTP:molybdopterin cytidylyltransferase MocA